MEWVFAHHPSLMDERNQREFLSGFLFLRDEDGCEAVLPQRSGGKRKLLGYRSRN